jgi:glycosyltransferase involved in cell wall biosynthesis
MSVIAGMSLPKVSISVLLSVYNAEKYVGIAIESILNQTFTDFELIAIDDCSTDNSWQIVQKYMSSDGRIKAVRNHTNLGGCETLNVGLKLAKGKYIARLDNDDWSYPDRLERQFNFLESHPSVGIVGGTIEIMNENGQLIGIRKYNISDKEIRKHIFRYSPFAHPLVMIRKTVLDKVGCYDPVFAPADDYELYFRIGSESQFENLPDVLLRYRVVSNSITSKQTKKMELATIKVRNCYSKNSNYHFSCIDKIYNILHYMSIFLIPSKIKIFLFNLLRNS